jgi:hypothetical protein
MAMGTTILNDKKEIVTAQVVPARTCASAAIAAAEIYAPSEIESHAKVIADAWEARLKEQSKAYAQRYLGMFNGKTPAGEVSPESAEPISLHLGIPYQWWNVLLAGPFQPIAPLGPFLPHKIIRHGEPSFMLCALWRNPLPIPFGPNPSAAQIMSPFEYRVWLETCNLTACANGPDFGPFTSVFGGGNVNVFAVFLAPGAFAVPPQGRPNLYEMNMVVDVLGPGPGLPPFSGYATWVLDPDIEPPFLGVPGQGPRLQHDIPARFTIYV